MNHGAAIEGVPPDERGGSAQVGAFIKEDVLPNEVKMADASASVSSEELELAGPLKVSGLKTQGWPT